MDEQRKNQIIKYVCRHVINDHEGIYIHPVTNEGYTYSFEIYLLDEARRVIRDRILNTNGETIEFLLRHLNVYLERNKKKCIIYILCNGDVPGIKEQIEEAQKTALKGYYTHFYPLQQYDVENIGPDGNPSLEGIIIDDIRCMDDSEKKYAAANGNIYDFEDLLFMIQKSKGLNEIETNKFVASHEFVEYRNLIRELVMKNINK